MPRLANPPGGRHGAVAAPALLLVVSLADLLARGPEYVCGQILMKVSQFRGGNLRFAADKKVRKP